MKENLRNAIGLKLTLGLLLALLVTPLYQFNLPAQSRAKSAAVNPYSSKPSKAALAWANKELGRMSLDEKIGQLIAVGINATFLN